MTVRGVIVAAGYGTRFLPVTRCVPKELLPLVDRPALDFVLEEMEQAGIRDVLVITSRRKRALEDWFDRDPELEAAFSVDGASARLAQIAPRKLNAHFVRQHRMGGTGDALLHAAAFAEGHPVVVAFPDDLFVGDPNASAQLVAAHERTGCSVLAAADLTGEDVSRYGVIDFIELDGVRHVRRVVEKPPAGIEPSHLISLGRYLYTPEFFEVLARHRDRHAGAGEFFPMGAIDELAAAGRVVAEVVTAERRDTGAPLGYLQAVFEEALSRPELGPQLAAWLRARLDSPS